MQFRGYRRGKLSQFETAPIRMADEFRDFAGTDAIINRVLVVEDDADNAAFLKMYLSEQGFEVELARDGGQAQSSFVMHRPDAVILDLILPGESGFEICERFRQSEKHLPIVVLTAIELEDARDLAQRVGANAYVTKPFDPEELCRHLKDAAEDCWRRQHGVDEAAEEASDRVRFACPKCERRIKVKAKHRGRTMTCPECREPITVPRHD